VLFYCENTWDLEDIKFNGGRHGNILYLFERECVQRRHQRSDRRGAIFGNTRLRKKWMKLLLVAKSVIIWGATVTFYW
jgi:pyruvate carboxylase